MKRKMALDVGDRTIGVAVTDPLGITAQGLTTLERVGIRKDSGKILALIRELDCDTVVIGLPLNLDGSDSMQTEKIREFRTLLENKLRSTGGGRITFDWQDERFTTKMAEQVLIQAGAGDRRERKKVIDKQAAILILQTWMERHKNEQ